MKAVSVGKPGADWGSEAAEERREEGKEVVYCLREYV